MNENTAKLVKALRSGEYAQAKGRLRIADDFCCLGVACDISGLGNWKLDFDDRYVYVVHPAPVDLHKRHLDSVVLPEPVKEWLGWAAIDGSFLDDDEGEVNALASLNDSGSTFDEIANEIEKNFDALVDGRR